MSRRKPIVRVGHDPAGWVMRDFTDLEACTSNHLPDAARLPCTGIAVWRVVEDHGMRLDIGFWCDTDLPAVHRPREAA